MSKFVQQKIDNFKKIINNKHPSLTDEEKKAIGVLHTLFKEEKFQELIIDESKEEGFSIYLINCNLAGVKKYALITGRKPFLVDEDGDEYACEFANIGGACKRINGSAIVLNKWDLIKEDYFFIFKHDIVPEKIDPSMAWECYLNFITMNFSKEYIIARKAYDRVYSEPYEMIAEKVSESVKLMIDEEMKKRYDEIRNYLKSIGSVIGD